MIHQTTQQRFPSDIIPLQISFTQSQQIYNIIWQDEDFVKKEILLCPDMILLISKHSDFSAYDKIISYCQQSDIIKQHIYKLLIEFGRIFIDSQEISSLLFNKINDILEKTVLQKYDFCDQLLNIWGCQRVETKFGLLELKIIEYATMAQYKKLTEITGDGNTIDGKYALILKDINYIKHRIKLRQIIDKSSAKASELGQILRNNLKKWFSCTDIQFTIEQLHILKRNINRDKGIYNCLTLSQICVLEDNLEILKVVISSEYHLNLLMTIVTPTKFGDTIIPKGSNLLQLGVILNSKKCLPYLMQKGGEFNYINQKSAEGETIFGLSMRTKDKSSAVIDDEQFLANELKNNEITGDNILIKSLQYNNIHMLLKWEKLILRVDFTLEIMRKVMLKNKDYHAMIDLCQSEEAVRVTKRLTTQSIAFIVDNYLFNDQYWRKILTDFFDESLEDYLSFKNKEISGQLKLLQDYEYNKYSLMAEIVPLPKIIENKNYSNSTKNNNLTITFPSKINEQFLYQTYKIFNLELQSQLDFIITLSQDVVQIFDDIIFKGAMKIINNMIIEKNFNIPIKPDTRATDYENGIYNGFYPVHYVILQPQNKNLKQILEFQILAKTKSYIVISYNKTNGILLPPNTSTLQMLLICGKFTYFYVQFENVLSKLKNKKLPELTTLDQQYLEILIEPNLSGNSLLDYLLLAEFQEQFLGVYQKLQRLYYQLSDITKINIKNQLEIIIFNNRFSFIKHISDLFNIFEQKPDQLVIFAKQIIICLQQESIMNQLKQLEKSDQGKCNNLYCQAFTILILFNEIIGDDIKDKETEIYIKSVINFSQFPNYLTKFQSNFVITQVIENQADQQFLDIIVQNQFTSKLFDSIVKGDTFYVLQHYQQIGLQIDQRQTNFETIFNGFNALAYAILFSHFELVTFLFQFESNYVFSKQICIFAKDSYLVFNNNCTYLALAILAQSVQIFDYLLQQPIILQQIIDQKISYAESMTLTRLAAYCNFNHIFTIKIILQTELLYNRQFVLKYPYIPSFLFELGKNSNMKGFRLVYEFVDKYGSQGQYLDQLYYGFIQRINGYSLIDYLCQLNQEKLELLQNLSQQALLFLFKEQEIRQQVKILLSGYYFYDDDIFDDKMKLYKQFQNMQFDIPMIQQADNIVPRQMYCKISPNSNDNYDSQWITTLKYDETRIIMTKILSYDIKFEERETNLVFNIHKGFAAIHYAILFNRRDVVKLFLKDQGNLFTQYDTFLQGKENLLFLPKNSSPLHISILLELTDISNFLVSFYQFEWFDMVINSETLEKEDTSFLIEKINMPVFKLPIIKAAAIGNAYITNQYILTEIDYLVKNNQDIQIGNSLAICCKNGNLKYFKRLYKLVEQYDRKLAFSCLMRRYPSNYIENLSLIQITQRLTVYRNININYIWEMENFIQNQIGSLNYYFTKHKQIHDMDIDKYYFVPKDCLVQIFYDDFNIFNNPKIFKTDTMSNKVAFEQQYICKDEQVRKIVTEKDIMKFQLNFSNQSFISTKWLEACKFNNSTYILSSFQYAVNSVEYRPTNFKNEIFFGFSGIHYTILKDNLDIFMSLVKHEYQQKTIVDQAVFLNDVIYFIPKNTNFLQMLCILRKQNILGKVCKTYTKLCIQVQYNIYNHSILDLFALSGLFSVEIAQYLTFPAENLEIYSQASIRTGSLQFIQYIYSLKQLKYQFQRFLISEIAKDQFPPEEIQNYVHKFLSKIYDELEIYAMRHPETFEQQFISLYGQETYVQMRENFEQKTNEKLLNQPIKTKNLIQKINPAIINQNQTTQIASSWYDACFENDLEKVRILNNVRTFDKRDSNPQFNQYRGWTGLHYALLSHGYKTALYLLQFEQHYTPKFDNIVVIDGQYILIPKNTPILHLVIAFKFDRFLTFIAPKNAFKNQLNSNLFQVCVAADYFPNEHFTNFYTLSQQNLMMEIVEFGEIYAGISCYLEGIDVNIISLRVIKQIFEKLNDANGLFTKAVEFCWLNWTNPSIQNLLKTQKHINITELHSQLIQKQTHSTICDYQQVYNNNFIIENFIPQDTVEKHEFFDAVIQNNIDKVLANIQTYKQKFDTRQTSHSTITGFNALFYAIYYHNIPLIFKILPLQQTFTLPFDTILPNKFFISKGANLTQIAAISSCKYALFGAKIRPKIDFRGFNFAFFLAQKGIFCELLERGMEGISAKKHVQWVEKTRNLDLAELLVRKFSKVDIQKNLKREMENKQFQNDNISQFIKYCLTGDEVEGVKKGQFGTEKELMLWILRRGRLD
eukprot:EST42588.1 Hypothetical protein SS50377_17907 [Spironucleus salmonicida]